MNEEMAPNQTESMSTKLTLNWKRANTTLPHPVKGKKIRLFSAKFQSRDWEQIGKRGKYKDYQIGKGLNKERIIKKCQ